MKRKNESLVRIRLTDLILGAIALFLAGYIRLSHGGQEKGVLDDLIIIWVIAIVIVIFIGIKKGWTYKFNNKQMNKK